MIKNSANSVLVSLHGMVIPGIDLFLRKSDLYAGIFVKFPASVEKAGNMITRIIEILIPINHIMLYTKCDFQFKEYRADVSDHRN